MPLCTRGYAVGVGCPCVLAETWRDAVDVGCVLDLRIRGDAKDVGCVLDLRTRGDAKDVGCVLDGRTRV